MALKYLHTHTFIQIRSENEIQSMHRMKFVDGKSLFFRRYISSQEKRVIPENDDDEVNGK